MKRVVSVSLGSSRRNHTVRINLLGEEVQIERLGTDGSLKKAINLIKELDGNVDAIGMGGIDQYIYAGGRKYEIKDAKRLARAARMTPITDGSGLKNTLERRSVFYMQDVLKMDLANKKVLIVSGVDRFGMAEAFNQIGSRIIFGDLIFGLGIPVTLKSLKSLQRLAYLAAPVVTKLPFSFLYPLGEKQYRPSSSKFKALYEYADIIAGDYLYIRKYMPEFLPGKTILTNTVTGEDVEDLRRRGIGRLITTTPHLNGRSFGTNVMEGLLIAFLEKSFEQLTAEDYEGLLNKFNFQPWVQNFNQAMTS